MDEMSESIEGWTDQSISIVHHALRAPRRRLTVGMITMWTIVSESPEQNETVSVSGSVDNGSTVGVRQLAREIAAIEEEIPVERATGKPYHSVYTTLAQTHLPELDDVGAIQYDSDRQTVRPARNLHAFAVAGMVTASVAQLFFDPSEMDSKTDGTTMTNSITD